MDQTTEDVRKFAVQAAESTGAVPLAAIQDALDDIDGELGQRMLLPEANRPVDTPDLVRDVRAVRALQRYRLALEGLGS